jgi:hypothetical protein
VAPKYAFEPTSSHREALGRVAYGRKLIVDRFLETRSPPLCVSLKLIVPVERIFFIAVRHQTQVVRVVRIKQKSDCQIALAGKDSHFVHVFVAIPDLKSRLLPQAQSMKSSLPTTIIARLSVMPSHLRMAAVIDTS